MKTFGKCILIIIMSGFPFGCEKEFDINEPDVEQFIKLLKQGEYEFNYIPYFSPEDIPHLLMYAKDFREIDRFPRNPISSYMIQACKLGVCLLWVNETIRRTYPQPEPNLRFSSEVPILMKISYYSDYKQNSNVKIEDYDLDETELL